MLLRVFIIIALLVVCSSALKCSYHCARINKRRLNHCAPFIQYDHACFSEGGEVVADQMAVEQSAYLNYRLGVNDTICAHSILAFSCQSVFRACCPKTMEFEPLCRNSCNNLMMGCTSSKGHAVARFLCSVEHAAGESCHHYDICDSHRRGALEVTAAAKILREEHFCNYAIKEDGQCKVGIGFNLLKQGAIEHMAEALNITRDEALKVAKDEASIDLGQAKHLVIVSLTRSMSNLTREVPNFYELPFPVQTALVELTYHSKHTKRILEAAKRRDFESIILRLRESDWYKHSPERAKRNIDLIFHFKQWCSKLKWDLVKHKPIYEEPCNPDAKIEKVKCLRYKLKGEEKE